MNLVRPLTFLLTSGVFFGTAMAADNATSATASGQFRIPLVQTGSAASSLIASASSADTPVILRMGPRGQRVDLSPFAGVCFTMRSYKVKPTERLRDDDNGGAGYSTCQMGSKFRVRSADGPPSK